jgi:carbon monoxide dehydrogenase subunit G
VRLKNEFTVRAPVQQTYAVLLDVERVAPCLPGAVLDGGDGHTFTGSMTIKLGPVRSRFEGTVWIESADDRAHRAVLRAEAKDAGGQGSAAATITTQMHESRGATLVTVETDLLLSGPAAQFGRGVMQDVSGKLMRQFAETLAEEIRADTTTTSAARAGAGRLTGSVLGAADVVAPAGVIEYEETAVGRLPIGPAADAAVAAAAPVPRRPARERRTAEVLDLGAASRDAVLKRLVPVAIAAAAAVITFAVWRKRSS